MKGKGRVNDSHNNTTKKGPIIPKSRGGKSRETGCLYAWRKEKKKKKRKKGDMKLFIYLSPV